SALQVGLQPDRIFRGAIYRDHGVIHDGHVRNGAETADVNIRLIAVAACYEYIVPDNDASSRVLLPFACDTLLLSRIFRVQVPSEYVVRCGDARLESIDMRRLAGGIASHQVMDVVLSDDVSGAEKPDSVRVRTADRARVTDVIRHNQVSRSLDI